MVNSDIRSKRERELADARASAAKIFASVVPGGTSVVELFREVFGPPIHARTEAWFERITTRLAKLEAQNGGFTVADLVSDDQFVSVLVNATHVATRHHQEEKIAALVQAVEHTAKGVNIEPSLQLQFIRYVDELSPAHLAILMRFSWNKSGFREIASYDDLYREVEASRMMSKDEFWLICEDLSTRSLIRISDSLNDFQDVYANFRIVDGDHVEGPKVRVTDIGNDFLAYVMS